MYKPLLRTQSLTLKDRNILCWTGWEVYLNRLLAMQSHVTERTLCIGQRPAETSCSEKHAADSNRMCGFHNHNKEWRNPNTRKAPLMQLHPCEILENGVAWPWVQKRGTRHGTHNMGRKRSREERPWGMRTLAHPCSSTAQVLLLDWSVASWQSSAILNVSDSSRGKATVTSVQTQSVRTNEGIFIWISHFFLRKLLL